MATYVISDIHGYYCRFMDLLEQIHFDPSVDTCYVLGDCLDRGINSGAMIDWILSKPQEFRFTLGNHDDIMLSFFKEIVKQKDYLDDVFWEQDVWDRFNRHVWSWNGGSFTLGCLMDLSPREREKFLDIVRSWPLYYDIEVNGRRFVLVHAGFAMHGMRMSDDYFERGIHQHVKIDGFPDQHSQSLLWVRENWFLSDDAELPCDVVFGHTPTTLIERFLEEVNRFDEEKIEYQGKGGEILHWGRKHAIDTGRGRVGILRLDDMMEFYSEIEEE